MMISINNIQFLLLAAVVVCIPHQFIDLMMMMIRFYVVELASSPKMLDLY